MTREEALTALFASIDESMTEKLCGKRGNFLETMLRSDFHIPRNIAVHVPENLKDAVIQHYEKNGFRVTDCGRKQKHQLIPYVAKITQPEPRGFRKLIWIIKGRKPLERTKVSYDKVLKDTDEWKIEIGW